LILKPSPLKGQKKFKRIFKEGIRLKTENIVLYFNPVYDFPLKYAVIVESKFGKAIERNKIKRQARAIIRTHSLFFLPYFGNLLIYFQRGFNLNFFEMHNLLIKKFMELRKCLKNLQ